VSGQSSRSVAKSGSRASFFEARALTGLVREVYFPWLAQPAALQAGPLVMPAVSADEPGHKPLSRCKIVPVVLTLYAGQADYEYHRAH